MNVKFLESGICCIALPFPHRSLNGFAPYPAAGSSCRKIRSTTFWDIELPIWFPSSDRDTARLNLFGNMACSLIVSSFRIRRLLEVIHCPLEALLVMQGDLSNQHFSRSLLESQLMTKSRFMGSSPSLSKGTTKIVMFCNALVEVMEGAPV